MPRSTPLRYPRRRGSSPKRTCLGGLAVVAACFLLAGCPAEEAPIPDDSLELTACAPNAGEVDLGCSAPPDTFDTSGLSGTGNGSAWDAWAWSSFAAYNWPALTSDDTTTYPTGFVRGVPNTRASFVGASSTDVTVWETFKEKRELFNSEATPGAWQELTFDPTYAPDVNGGQVEPCGDADAERLAALGAHPRILAQISKQDFVDPSAGGASTVDETAEVASPAQESTDTLCAGYSGQDLTNCTQILFQPIDGDPTKEASATGDNPRDNPVGPRVFAGKPSADAFVYYEVKLNYDYYSYVANNGLNDYDTAVKQAQNAEIHLPFRTTATQKPENSANSDALTSYSAQDTATCYGKQLSGCTFSNQSGVGPDQLPRVGSVQLKAAWLPASELDLDGYTLADYHTTEAVFYRSSESQPEGLCYAVQDFGLIGLHIIQRVHGGTGTSAETIGGTFVFATWEHESIAGGAGYSYVNYLSNFGEEQSNPNPYPNTADGIQVSRLQSYPLGSTNTVNDTAQGELGGSFWSNYRLIGTQFQAISSESDSTALGQPYYLANLVIETNRGLQQFQGLPPGVTPIANYPQIKPSFQFFAPTVENIVWAGQGYVMGGCMGCHGVAQVQGFNFSFVLLDGSKGTKPDTAEDVLIPPVPVSSSG